MYLCLINEESNRVLLCTTGHLWVQEGERIVEHHEWVDPENVIYDPKLGQILEKTEEQRATATRTAQDEAAEGEQNREFRVAELGKQIALIKDEKTRTAFLMMADILGIDLT